MSNANGKRLVKNTMYMYLRMLVSMFVSLFTSRIVLQQLGVDNYGIYGAVGGIVVMFTFVNSAMASSTSRFISYAIGENQLQNIRKIFQTTLFVHVCLTGLVVLTAETIGLWYLHNYMVLPNGVTNEVMFVYQCSIFNAVLGIMGVPFSAIIIAHERMNVYAYFTILDVVAKLGIALMLIYVGWYKLSFYAGMLSLTAVMVFLINLIYCFKQKFIHSLSLKFDKIRLKEILRFGSWSMYVQLSTVASTQGVNLVLNYMFGVVVNAAYTISTQIQSAVRSFSLGFQVALNPQLTKTYSAGELENHYTLLYRSMRLSFFLITIFALPIFINAESVLNIWLGKYPVQATSFVRWVLLISIVQTISNPVGVSVEACGNIGRMSFWIATLTLFSVPMAYIALKIIDDTVVPFVVLFFVQVFILAIKLYYCKRNCGLPLTEMFKESIIPILLITATSYVTCNCLNYFIPTVSIYGFLCIVLDFIVIILLCFYIGMNKTEREWAISLIKSRLGRSNVHSQG